MIIYHAISFYQTLVCIVHALMNKEEKKVLLFSSSIKSNVNTDVLKRIFEKVIYIDIRMGLNQLMERPDEVSIYFNNLFIEHNIEVTSDTKIIAGGCHYNFGVYLVVNNIPFYYIEEACGLLSNPDHVRNIDRNNRKEVDLIDGYGLYDATAESIVGIYCNINEQENGYQNEKMIHFDILKELMDLAEVDIKTIMKVFGEITSKKIQENSVVVLAQHYANLNMMRYEEQALLYGLVFDYFLDSKKILVKKHPADQMAYSRIFKEVEVIEEKFLSEFIPIVLEPMPDMVATISSTGIRTLRGVLNNSMQFDFAFEEIYRILHKVYFALEFSVKFEKKVLYYNLNDSMMRNFKLYSDNKFKNLSIQRINNFEDTEANTILLIDSLPRKHTDDIRFRSIEERLTINCNAEVIIFLNSSRDYLFHELFNTKKWENVVPIVIKKQNSNNKRDYSIYNDFENEVFYVYSKNEEIRNIAKKFKCERTLKNMEIVVKTEGFKSETDYKIAVLEGMLEATEQKLKYYMDICKKNGYEEVSSED